MVGINSGIFFGFACFSVKQLNDCHPGNMLLKKCVQTRKIGKDILESCSYLVFKFYCCIDHQGQNAQDNKSQLPITPYHQDNNKKKLQEVAENSDYAA